jgi:hypothetical protein
MWMFVLAPLFKTAFLACGLFTLSWILKKWQERQVTNDSHEITLFLSIHKFAYLGKIFL